MKKRIISTLLALVMMLSLLPGTAWAADTYGTCGLNLTWALDSSGTLTIKGTGSMSSYTGSPRPWRESLDAIKRVVIQKGVTSVGFDTFNGCRNITDVNISDGPKIIYGGAFSDCSSLASISIPVSVTEIWSAAFEGCDKLSDVYYAGTRDQWMKVYVYSRNTPLVNARVHFNSTNPIPTSKYTVTFTPNGGTGSTTSKEYADDAVLGTLPTTSRLGYKFDGWYTAKSGGEKVSSSTKVNHDMVIYAHWTESSVSVTVTFDPGVGSLSGSSTKNVTVGQAYGPLPTPESSFGYIFDGWYDSWSCETKITESTIVTKTENHTLFANWIRTQRTITFDPNGGTVSPTTKQYWAPGTLGTLPTPSRAGYKFDGWYLTKTGNVEVTATTLFSQDVTLYAHWSPDSPVINIYTVKFDANGGKVTPASKTYKANTTLGTLPTPTRTGYKFDGWYTAASGGSQISASTKVSKDITLYAHWSSDSPVINIYTVKFDANGGKVTLVSRTYTANSTLGTLPTPTRTGYKFDGWYTAKTGGTKVLSTKKVTANMTLYAHWTKEAAKVTIKLDPNGGTVSKTSISVTKNSTYYSQLPTPTRAGYEFDGWYTTKTGTTKITSATKATANRTIYAHWTKPQDDAEDVSLIRVTFNPNGGTVSQKAKLVVSTSKYKELPTPTRPGQHFVGWYTAKTGGKKVTEKSRVTATADQTLYARWSTKAVTTKTNKTGKWTVSIPAKYRVALYTTPTASQVSTTIPGTSVFKDIPCTRRAELSNGTVRYYGTINGRTGWFTYSCEMDVD